MKMIRFKKPVSFLLVLAALLASVVPAALAAETGPAEETGEELSGAGELIGAYLAEHRIPGEKIGIAYYNTGTGEEYLFNGDKYFLAASVYKVALNMYWAEKVYEGEIDFDMPVLRRPLSQAQSASLIHSNNQYSTAMMDLIGTYRAYRTAVAPFYGLTEEEAGAREYRSTNDLTPAMVLHCLKMLEEDGDRYPGVIDCMLEAEPDDYLRRGETEYDIAQKYGYYPTQRGEVINIAGIVYTDSPFLIVILSVGVKSIKSHMYELGRLLADYTQYPPEDVPAKDGAA